MFIIGGYKVIREGGCKVIRSKLWRVLWKINPNGALPLFIGGGDRLGGEGVQEELEFLSKTNMSHFYFAPPHHYVVPSPYK
ncbi:MAG: hypothetical protein U0L77_02280, partial [Prevotellamassilia sp.]|nr:hypothetical protein [Prevotellamassilia sp.]